MARRARADRTVADPPLQVLAAALPEVTDAHWQRIAPLLPEESTTGRPARDARCVLAGILWVMRTGSGWHDLPEAFGPWSTVERRYRRWRADGIWSEIVTVLTAPAPHSAS